MFKESHLHIEVIIAVLLFPAVYSQNKVDYGVLSACVNKEDHSLQLKCYYPACDDNTPFNCDLFDVEENKTTLIGSSDWAMVNSNVSYLNATSGKCRLNITATIYHNKTKIYKCSLSRRTSQEEKKLTVEYNDKRKG
ncbi:hypothetical protein R3I94_006436 [Phoxinus phoxinus]